MKWFNLTFLIVSCLLQYGDVACQDSNVTKYENVVYGMVSGTALLMDVYKPAESNRIGILIISGSAFGYFHSKSYNQIPLKDDYSLSDYIGPFAKSLVTRGYTVFMINHRFAPMFHFPDIFYDCQRAVRFIRYNAGMYSIDPNKIGAFGHSNGAYLSSMLGVKDTIINKPENPIDSVSSKVQAVVTLAAAFILSDLDKKEDSIMNNDLVYQANINYIGESPQIAGNKFILSGKYAQASPITHLSKDDASFLIYHSEDDLVVPFRQASAMYKKLKETGIPVKFILQSNHGHNPKPDIDEVDLWFKEYLQLH